MIVRAAFCIAAGLLWASGRASGMELSSANIANGALLSTDQVKSGCGGNNVSPALSWSGAPAATKSFAITAYDPDAHGGWWHWIVFDIASTTQSLPAGAGGGTGLPAGAVQGENDFGDSAYDGACPPAGSGQHHYVFTVWALADAMLAFTASSKPQQVADYVKAHALAHADLIGIYER